MTYAFEGNFLEHLQSREKSCVRCSKFSSALFAQRKKKFEELDPQFVQWVVDHLFVATNQSTID